MQLRGRKQMHVLALEFTYYRPGFVYLLIREHTRKIETNLTYLRRPEHVSGKVLC